MILSELLINLSLKIEHFGSQDELMLHLKDMLLIAASFLQELEQREEKVPVKERCNNVRQVIGHWTCSHVAEIVRRRIGQGRMMVGGALESAAQRGVG